MVISQHLFLTALATVNGYRCHDMFFDVNRLLGNLCVTSLAITNNSLCVSRKVHCNASVHLTIAINQLKLVYIYNYVYLNNYL